MGIVNVTPDSFSDGGRYATTRPALDHCEQLLRDGADLLDIGGESTRPGTAPVPVEEELRRVLPVLREAVRLDVPVSIDTSKPEVMRSALDLGVDIVNDVWALRAAGRERGDRRPSGLRRLPDAHAWRAGFDAAHADGRRCRAGGAVVSAARDRPAARAAAWRANGLSGIPASASARQWRRISRCWRASANCWQAAIRCWWAGRASRRLAP